ncbi:hypothetical protein QG37_03040 [Candidozyma auris]|uniref:Uncharacterized protein n=1 Tax=Candidozyma auris TaxID=498019 RepID=A0A0L0P270_CANAR|nr:hypothetical protein QG37_03040 [[Candida] auris]
MFGCRQCLESNGVDELESKLNVIEEKVCHFSGLSLENLSDLPLTLRIHFSFVAWDFKAFCDNFVLLKHKWLGYENVDYKHGCQKTEFKEK